MPSSFQVLIILSLIANIGIGLFALGLNRQRRVNQFFFLLTLVGDLWLLCLLASSFARRTDDFIFWVRQSSALSALLPVAFDLLRSMTVSPNQKWRATLKASLVPWLLFLGVMVLCQTRWFVHDVILQPGKVCMPVYGEGQYLFVAYWVVMLGILVKRGLNDMRTIRGVERTELQYLFFAFVVGAIMGVSFSNLIPLVMGSDVTLSLVPLIVTIFDGIIAYGIVTQRLLGVGYLVRRMLAYAMLLAYLIGVYAAAWWGTKLLTTLLFHAVDHLNYLVAAMAVAVSLAPADGLMQRFASRMLVHTSRMDENKIMQDGMQMLQSVATLDDLLRRFANWMRRMAGTDRMYVLLSEGGHFVQHFPLEENDRLPTIEPGNLVVRILSRRQRPLALYMMARMQPEKNIQELAQWMKTHNMDLIIGIYAKTELSGLVMLGSRLSGRVYDAKELDVLQLLCNQLGVAVSNARLYTKLQNHAIYDRALLDSLTSGVIGVNAEGRITVFNKEAQRITGASVAEVSGHPVSALPPVLAEALAATRQTQEGVSNRDAFIIRSGQRVPVRLSTSLFRDHAGVAYSALLVFNDMTRLMKLEEQLRRTDRLSSLGVLSAGMAHEIKNPLVSIKTFAQLLPERYDDSEFRETFSVLVNQEIERINQTVSRLLTFSRSADPSLNVMHVHAFLEDNLRLLAVQLRNRNIALVKTFEAGSDTIHGDAHLLSQAFVNFFLNAIDAMPAGGTLTVVTTDKLDAEPTPRKGAGDSARKYLRVEIRDTGCGIPQENLVKIFDPFFTTKSEGTGMGLAVAHGILMEHHAQVDVTSEEGHGAVFTILIPLAQEQEKHI